MGEASGLKRGEGGWGRVDCNPTPPRNHFPFATLLTTASSHKEGEDKQEATLKPLPRPYPPPPPPRCCSILNVVVFLQLFTPSGEKAAISRLTAN